MAYKLYTDKQENFECKIYLEGASLQEAKSRLVVEGNNFNLLFEGSIEKDGNCEVPISRLRGLLGEDDTGKMKLEVIAEDTYFLPWESDFVVDTNKKIKVEVKSQEDDSLSSKPQMVVSEVKHSFDAVDDMVSILENQNIDKKSLIENKRTVVPIIVEYVKNISYNKGIKNFIKEVINRIQK